MHEARIEILNLLRDGVIGTDEAERLLSALERGERRRRDGGEASPWEDVAKGMVGIGRTVASTVNQAVRAAFGRARKGEPSATAERLREFTVAPGARLAVANDSFRGGAVRLVGVRGESCRVECDGGVELERDGPDVRLRWRGSGIEVQVPDALGRIQVHTTGGDLVAEGVHPSLRLDTLGGDVRLDGVEGTFEATTLGGDVRIDLSKLAGDSRVTTMGGSVEVLVDEGCAGLVRARSLGGQVEFEPGLGEVRRAPDGFAAVGELAIGPEPHARLDLETAGGRITVRRKTP